MDYLTASILKSLKGKTIVDVKVHVKNDTVSLHKLILSDGTEIEMQHRGVASRTNIKYNASMVNQRTTRHWVA